MAETPSKMLALGTKMPEFRLPDTISGKTISNEELKSNKGTVIVFICNHCPYVVHIINELAAFAAEYQKKGISFAAISSNDVEKYPQDSPEKMKEFAGKHNFSFPYLYDETQEVAKAFQAACTPDFYMFDGRGELVYRGRFDEASPGNGKPVNGKDIREAAEALLSGKRVNPEQYYSIGCNIKWK